MPGLVAGKGGSEAGVLLLVFFGLLVLCTYKEGRGIGSVVIYVAKRMEVAGWPGKYKLKQIFLSPSLWVLLLLGI
jgi:hypothetical protein